MFDCILINPTFSQPSVLQVAKNQQERKMAKRGATSELNHDNWNEDEESEEAGTFQQAPADVLKTRVIRQAKRRAGGEVYSLDGFSSLFQNHAIGTLTYLCNIEKISPRISKIFWHYKNNNFWN